MVPRGVSRVAVASRPKRSAARIVAGVVLGGTSGFFAGGFTGYKIERKFNLGAREIVIPALESGQIDLEVDYLATLLAFLDKEAKGSTDASATAKTLDDKLKAKGLVQYDFAPAVDQNGFVVTKDTATRLKLSKISDLTAVAKDLTFGGPPTCPNRGRPARLRPPS